MEFIKVLNTKCVAALLQRPPLSIFFCNQAKSMYCLESSFAEKNVWVLVDSNLTVNQQCTLMAKMAKSILGCIWRNIISRSVTSLLSSTGEADSGILFVVIGSNVVVESQLTLTFSLHWKLLQKCSSGIEIFPVSCGHFAPVGRMTFFLP